MNKEVWAQSEKSLIYLNMHCTQSLINVYILFRYCELTIPISTVKYSVIMISKIKIYTKKQSNYTIHSLHEKAHQ